MLDVAALAADLMAVDSTSGQEAALMTLVERRLGERGWTVTRIPVTEGRHDVLATSGAGPFVTLSTHLDTVPPYVPPRVDGDRLTGRGACDAKGIAAAMWCAAERLRADKVPVALLFVVGEEVSHDGARAADAWARAHDVPSIALINGEPTEGTLAVGTKGALRATVRVQGRAAHSAYPALGRSATRDLVHLLARLDDLALPTDALLGETTVNIGSLSGGVADNVLAPWAEARLMARLVGPAAEVERCLREWAGDAAAVEIGMVVPPVLLATLPGFQTSVVAFATDVPELSAWGTPYLFGPGSIHVAHTADEWIAIDELRAAVDAYERLARLALAEAAAQSTA